MADSAKDRTADSAAAADLEALAERYLDLWQDQVSAMAADGDFASAFQTLFGPANWAAMTGSSPMAAWQAMMARCAPGAAAGGPSAERRSDDQAREPDRAASGAGGAGASAGAASAAAASDGGRSDLDQLTHRLADLEARIAAMETGGAGGKAGPGGGAKKGARRKRS